MVTLHGQNAIVADDAFISYGRADSKAFAAKLQSRLAEAGFQAWFDFNDIPLGVDYQIQIDEGIAKADNFLFVIAPHSVNSPYCLKEVELAIRLNKRIIPLLHVEKITWETWQERNPGKSEADWQAYQEKGLHSSFPNMHPVISKINWVYLREGIDDFEAGFKGLTDLLNRHRDYVRQHTVLLNRAISWERQQKQTRHLLTGEERQAAETWLKYRFKEEQAPCEPTLLHAEFICESIKNANNLMTQAFLCYAEVESEIMTQIRGILLRESITVWMNKTDIQTGETFEDAIHRGIEQADTIVYLLSPASLASEFCQHELDYALGLNKRIIPLLIQPIDLDQVHPAIRPLQFIDFTDNQCEADLLKDFDQLLRTLQEDAAYYEDHKLLLTKALKWERQNRNPTILLQGYNLRHAETWLKTAQSRSQHRPTALQETLITESLRQPPATSVEVFISYSRADSDLARKLNDQLQIYGKTTWFDQESIASGADFQREIYQGIEKADNIVFILSPKSVTSPYCKDEVDYAANLNKRFVTVLHRPVNTADLHPELAKVQWIDFNKQGGDFFANFNQLVRTLETDRDHVHNHTKWLQRAIEWQNHHQSSDLLLRGSEFAIAETWLQEAKQGKKQPAATELQSTFLQASRDAIQAAVRREKRQLTQLRLLLAGMTVVAVVAIGATINAVQSQRKAIRGEIKALVATSKAQLALKQELDALLDGLRAAKKLKRTTADPSLQAEVLTALQQSVYAVKEKNRLDLKGLANQVIFSPNGQLMAATDAEGVKLWQTDGTFLVKLDDPDYQQDQLAMQFSGDNQTIVTFNWNWSGGDERPIKVWGLDGKLRSQFPKQGGFKSVRFNPDGQTVATFDGRTWQLWQLDGKAPQPLEGADADHTILQFSQDGQTLIGIALTSDGTKQQVKIWRRDGKLQSSFETKVSFAVSAFNHNGSQLMLVDGDTLALVQADGTVLKTFTQKADPDRQLGEVQFSLDGQTVAAAYNDKNNPNGKTTLKLWRLDGTLRATLSGHDQRIRAWQFSPNGQRIATASQDKTVKLWDLDGKLLTTLVGHGDWVQHIAFNPQNKTLASASDDGTLRLWTTGASRVKTWDSSWAVFSQNNQVFVTTTQNGPVELRQMDGTLIKTLIAKSNGTANIQLSHDGNTVVTHFNNPKSYGPVQVWDGKGNLMQTLIEKTAKPNGQDGKPVDVSLDVKMSEDGSTLVTALKSWEFYGPVQLWNRKGKLVKTLMEKTPKLDDQDWVSMELFLSQDGQTIVTSLRSSESYGPVQLWNGEGKLIKTLIEQTPHPKDQWISVDLSLSNEGKAIVTSPQSANTYGPVKLWDAQGNNLATLAETIESNSKKLSNVSFSRDSQHLLTVTNRADNHSVVKLWKTDGTLLKTLVDEANIPGSVTAQFSQLDDQPASTTVSNQIITAVPGGALQIWGINGSLLNTVTQKLEIAETLSDNLTLSPDGEILALKNKPKTIQLWEVQGKQGQPLQTIVYEGFVASLRFSPDSQRFAAGSWDNTIKLWDQRSNAVIPFTGHTSGVTQLRFAPTGQYLVSASEQGRVILFPLAGLTDLDAWITKSCDYLKDYLKTSQKEDDRGLCDGYLSQKP